jgi:hypothetical protein
MNNLTLRRELSGINDLLTRKPNNWTKVGAVNLTKREFAAVNSLPKLDGNNLVNPLDNFKNDLPQYFILLRGDRQYLVNTEGYTYCRYIGLIN